MSSNLEYSLALDINGQGGKISGPPGGYPPNASGPAVLGDYSRAVAFDTALRAAVANLVDHFYGPNSGAAAWSSPPPVKVARDVTALCQGHHVFGNWGFAQRYCNICGIKEGATTNA